MEEMVTQLINFIPNYGFPIAVTIYLLFERQKGYGKLQEVVEKNTQCIQELSLIIKGMLK